MITLPPLLYCLAVARRCIGAGKEARTPDLNLGKVALYQLSYSRVTTLGCLACSHKFQNTFKLCFKKAPILVSHQILSRKVADLT